MAFRPGRAVTKVEIDNRHEGRVVGRVWLLGRAEPVRLDLHGNCLADIAGCRAVFENPAPAPEPKAAKLGPVQAGEVGEMTASRKVQTLAVPLEELPRIREANQPIPLRAANAVYLEWFSEANGRVVIESTDFAVAALSEPQWRLSREGEAARALASQQAFADFLARKEMEKEQARASWDEEADRADDEFAWEKTLRESDARTDKYGDVLEKYRGHPDEQRLVAREMGWNWLDDALDADARGLYDEARKAAASEPDAPELEPNPLSEGVDWIRTDRGDVRHPLVQRASEHAIGMWRRCKERGLLGNDSGDEDLHIMIAEAQILGSKLAGALDSLAYDHPPEGGFVVALLKRALQYFDNSMDASRKVEAKALLEPGELADWRRGLFEIRQEMLALMERFREA
ncbi:MAG: hypothetical protein JXR37_08690 [Kiritimatiellae bacterium]|nr:hypothetical protein [Kiritimatiellia bacterium]